MQNKIWKIKQEDDARVVLNHYISYYENQLRTKKGSGIRKKTGGNVILLDDPKKASKKNLK